MIVTGPLVGTISNKNPAPGNYNPKDKKTSLYYSLSGKI